MGYGNRLFTALLFMSAGSFLLAQESGFLRDINGTVEIRAPGESAWVNGNPGDRVEKQTLISTGFKSSAVITLGNSLIIVRPLTRLSLEEILRNEEGEQINVYLQTGRVRAEVSPPTGKKIDFTVRSPSTIASVRGTSFEFDTVNIRVFNGMVLYSRIGGRLVPVAGGGMSYVDEARRRVVSPFEAAAENLSPTLPIGSDSGIPTGNAPVISPGMGTIGIDFKWD